MLNAPHIMELKIFLYFIVIDTKNPLRFRDKISDLRRLDNILPIAD